MKDKKNPYQKYKDAFDALEEIDKELRKRQGTIKDSGEKKI